MTDQRTDVWFAQRCGKVTASRIADVMAKTKAGYGAGRANYMAELVAERLTGETRASFTNAAMQWGTDTEPMARDAYCEAKDCFVEEVGFVPHPTIANAGASPDGLVGVDGLVEVKCPNTATHLDTLLGAKIDRKYILQMHWQMLCTGREWCDFVSYDPRLPAAMQLHIERVPLDADLASEITSEVIAFLAELDDKVSALLAKYGE
jgi:putative phage-type endonuclease